MLRRRRTPEPDALEVELVEVTRDGSAAPGPTPVPTGSAERPGPRRRRGLLVAGGVVAVVAALGTAQLVELGRSPTAGVVDGLIGAVPTAPEQLWHAPGSHWSFVENDTVVLGAGRGVTMRDARTGDVVGERTDVGRCEPATDGSFTGRVLPVALCTRGPFIEDGISVMRLTAVAPTDGRTLWDHTLESSSWMSMATVVEEDVVEGDVAEEDSVADVLWVVQDDSMMRVVRLGLLDGTVRWSTEHESRGDRGMWIEVVDGRVAVGDSLLLDLATGESSGADPAAPRWVQEAEFPVPRGVARGTWADGRATLTVVAPDGTERFTLDGAIPIAWNTLVSDRADVLAVTLEDQRHVVVDAISGAELWEMPGPADLIDPNVVAYLPDVMIVASGRGLRAFAPRTGTELWSTPESSQSWTRHAVDERRLVTATIVDGGAGLRALDVETGEEAWRVPLPSPLHYLRGLHAADGVLVVQMESGTAAFATG